MDERTDIRIIFLMPFPEECLLLGNKNALLHNCWVSIKKCKNCKPKKNKLLHGENVLFFNFNYNRTNEHPEFELL